MRLRRQTAHAEIDVPDIHAARDGDGFRRWSGLRSACRSRNYHLISSQIEVVEVIQSLGVGLSGRHDIAGAVEQLNRDAFQALLDRLSPAIGVGVV